MKRSSSAVEYRKMYMTKRWRILRDKILVRDNYQCQHKGCGQFLQSGRNHPRSAVVHHLVPHKGDHGLFYSPNNLQAVCWTCHSGDIQSQEALGYDNEIGADGWPTDPAHPGAA
jgi:5-methylcytosine-specific restriction protein A